MDATLKLNARFQPKHRFELEDALQEILEREGLGEVTGGGTALSPDGEVACCDIELELTGGREAVQRTAELLGRMGIPKGSVLRAGEEELAVGTLEGMAYYSNGTDLPDEVYRSCDINHVIAEMERAMEGAGRMYSYWEGKAWTALYFYGSSFEEMRERVRPFLASYPLCQKCRVERIA